MKAFISKLDILGTDNFITYKKNQSYKSMTGGILSIIILLASFSVIFTLIYNFIFYRHESINYFKQINNSIHVPFIDFPFLISVDIKNKTEVKSDFKLEEYLDIFISSKTGLKFIPCENLNLTIYDVETISKMKDFMSKADSTKKCYGVNLSKYLNSLDKIETNINRHKIKYKVIGIQENFNIIANIDFSFFVTTKINLNDFSRTLHQKNFTKTITYNELPTNILMNFMISYFSTNSKSIFSFAIDEHEERKVEFYESQILADDENLYNSIEFNLENQIEKFDSRWDSVLDLLTNIAGFQNLYAFVVFVIHYFYENFYPLNFFEYLFINFIIKRENNGRNLQDERNFSLMSINDNLLQKKPRAKTVFFKQYTRTQTTKTFKNYKKKRSFHFFCICKKDIRSKVQLMTNYIHTLTDIRLIITSLLQFEEMKRIFTEKVPFVQFGSFQNCFNFIKDNIESNETYKVFNDKMTEINTDDSSLVEI